MHEKGEGNENRDRSNADDPFVNAGWAIWENAPNLQQSVKRLGVNLFALDHWEFVLLLAVLEKKHDRNG